MEEHQGIGRGIFWGLGRGAWGVGRGVFAAVACAALVGGCVESAPVPFGFYDAPLRIVAIEPEPGDGPVARDQTFTVGFNAYLDPRPINFFNAATLGSGGVRASTRVDYRMVDRQLIVGTRRQMMPGLLYDLGFNPDVLVSVTGQPFGGPPSIQFISGEHLDAAPDEGEPRAGALRWADVAPIFDPCNVCHQDPEWMLPPMTRDAMVGRASPQRPDLLLVRPYDAPSSYLMHKILWDYPLRDGTAQPPPWAGYAQLSAEAQRLIEAWIRAGAL